MNKYSNITNIILFRLKGTYEKFKGEQYDGNVKKKYAVNKLILVTMSDSNRTFNKWRKTTHEGKITDKMIYLTQFFESITEIVKKNNIPFENPFAENDLKLRTIRNLAKNTYSNLSDILKIWKFNIKDDKCYNLDRVLHKYIP